MKLIYHPHKGIICLDTGVSLLFGAQRGVQRAQFNYNPQLHAGRFPEEDYYPNALPPCRFRLSYTADLLTDIEILEGVIYIEEVAVDVGEKGLKNTLATLRQEGYTLKKTTYGYTDFNALFDIGDSYRNGGEKNEIAWFYTGTSFAHLEKSP